MPIPSDMIPKSSSAPKVGYDLLKPFLYLQGRAPDRVLGDGNCLFRALSRYLTGAEDHHLQLRKTITEFEAANSTVFKNLHEAINQTLFEDHLSQMKKPFVWGTNLEIIAVASLLQLDVYLAIDSYIPGVPKWLLYTPKLLSTLSNRHLLPQKLSSFIKPVHWIELAHISNIHFDSIKPLKENRLFRPNLEETNKNSHIEVIIQ